MRKAFLILFVLVGALGAWALASRNGADNTDAARYRTDAVSRGPIIATVSATGTVLATTTVIVGSQLSGQVVEILVDHNHEVKAGQVLARLNRDTLLARRDSSVADLRQARAARQLNDAQAEKNRTDLLRLQAVLRDAEAQSERARTLFRDAEATFERQSSLKERGIASDVAMQNATTQRDALRSAAASAEAQVASVRAQIASLDADLKVIEAQKASSDALIAKAEAGVRQIEVDLANSEIRSSVDGVVVQRNIELGQTVAASLQAPTLFLVAQNLKTIEVNINLDETDVGRVKAGQTVEFTVNAYPGRTFTGTVRLVRLGALNVQNVVIYTTIVTVKNDDLALLPGMTANARVFTERKSDVLRVSNAAPMRRKPKTRRVRFRRRKAVVGPVGQARNCSTRSAASWVSTRSSLPRRRSSPGPWARRCNALPRRKSGARRPAPSASVSCGRWKRSSPLINARNTAFSGRPAGPGARSVLVGLLLWRVAGHRAWRKPACPGGCMLSTSRATRSRSACASVPPMAAGPRCSPARSSPAMR
jgi:HlyD family secretion protein